MKNAVYIAPDADCFRIIGHWGRRRETPAALALRWIALVNRLQAIDPSLSTWFHWDDALGRPVTFEPTPEAQIARIRSAIGTTIDGRLVPEAGVQISNVSGPDPRSRSLRISMFAGNDNIYHDNHAEISTDPFAIPDADIVSYRTFRIAILALAEVFDVTQAVASPDDLTDLGPSGRPKGSMPLAWISYVAPRFAHLVTPPPRALVEQRPDGGLLMAATAETFRTDDPAHLAVARDIEAALAPFNALPWTAETGK